MALGVVPCFLAQACALVDAQHRTHTRPAGGICAVGIGSDGVLIGSAIISRPTSRVLQDGWTVEVVRVVVPEGVPNGCSMLLGAARRIAKEMGYRRAFTYTLPSEPGTSLRAAGWVFDGLTEGGAWSKPSRPRAKSPIAGPKVRWRAELRTTPAVQIQTAQTSGGCKEIFAPPTQQEGKRAESGRIERPSLHPPTQNFAFAWGEGAW